MAQAGRIELKNDETGQKLVLEPAGWMNMDRYDPGDVRVESESIPRRRGHGCRLFS